MQSAPPRSWTSNGLAVDQEQRLLLLGIDSSAMAMSVAMTSGKKTVDLIESLKNAGVEH